MKKIIIGGVLFLSTAFLTSCTITQGTYYPGYTNDFVYSVGYYGYRPYWGSGFGWGNGGYWRGYRAYNPGWHGHRW